MAQIYNLQIIHNYRGYDIVYNAYGKEEYTVQYDGDDVWFDRERDARAFIDTIV